MRPCLKEYQSGKSTTASQIEDCRWWIGPTGIPRGDETIRVLDLRFNGTRP